MCLSEKDNVTYEPFHNQLRKDEFPNFMKSLVKLSIAQFSQLETLAWTGLFDISNNALKSQQ